MLNKNIQVEWEVMREEVVNQILQNCIQTIAAVCQISGKYH